MLNVSEILQKKGFSFFLQRYLGQYLKQKLTIDQLTISIMNGTAKITDVNLDMEVLNEMADKYNLPIEFVEGFIKSVNISIPWKTLLHDSCFIEIKGVAFTVQPKHRSNNASVMDSIVGSVMTTSSLQLAKECIGRTESEDNERESENILGLDAVAQHIEAVFSRIKVRLRETSFKLLYAPKGSKSGTALTIVIDKIDYCQELGMDNSNADAKNRGQNDQSDAYVCKNFVWEGVTLNMEEFSSDNSSSLIKSSVFMECDNRVSDPYSTAPETPEPFSKPDFDYDEKSFSLHSPPSVASNSPTTILIAKLQGRNDVRLKLKNCDMVNGPKVLAEFNLGSTVIFLSPIQLHLISNLFGEFISPSSTNVSTICKDILGNKPMQLSDFNLIQRELQQQVNEPVKDHSLYHQQGWSSQCLEDSDEEFLPFNASNKHRVMNSSLFSNISDGSQSFISTGKPYFHGQGASNLKGEDVSVETSQFKLQISSIVVVILHEDILTPSPSKNGQMVSSSVSQMQSRAESFFNDLGTFAITPNTDKCLDQCHKFFNDIVKTNHLRFISSPCTVDLLDTTSSDTKSLETVLLFGLSDLVECLYNDLASSLPSGPDYYHLMKFEQISPNLSTSCLNLCSLSTAQTSIKVNINYTEKLLVAAKKYMDDSSRFEIELTLAPCTFEIDISLIDRISCLLNPKELHRKSSSTNFVNGYNELHQFISDNSNNVGLHLDFKLNSSSLTLKIRFPIPDLRSLADMNRAPWWKQTIRKDAMLLLLNDARLHTILNCDNMCNFFEIRCKELLASFQENPLNPAIEFLRASVGSDIGNAVNNEIGWPRLSFKINHPITQSIFEESEREDDSNPELGNSLIENLVHELCIKHKATDPSLFTYRKIASNNNEQLTYPGDRKVANEFFEWSNSCSHFIVDISLENLEIFLPSKHFYEILYNRITVDLLLWEPAAIVPPPVKDNSNFFSAANTFNWDPRISFNNNTGFQTYSLCRAASKYDSGSESDDESHPNFTSCHESKPKLKKGGETKNRLNGLQNKISLTVSGKNVCLNLNLPHKDQDGVLDSEYEGRLLAIASDVCFSTLVTAEEFPVTTYISLHTNNVEVYHKSRILANQYDPNVTLTSNDFHETDSIKSKENLILHVTESSAKANSTTPVGIGGDSLDALSLVIRSCFEPDRNVKNFRMALGLCGLTLHYYMTCNHESWFAQIVDFFDVIDYPITGYQPPEIVTELHLNASDCAIDYRPIHLPLRVFLTLGSFSVSSNIVAGTSISLVRFFIEDICFFLSRQCNTSSVNLRKDYVCVMDTSLFELILKSSDGNDQQVPKIDLLANSNALYIRTCADSCVAFQDLLQYCASDGDLQMLDQDTDEDEPVTGDLNTLVGNYEGQVDHAMMEDAMQDNLDEMPIKNDIENPNRKTEKPNCDLFLFPGETEGTPENQSPNLYPCLGNELGFASEADESFDSMDDFCILDDIPGSGILPKNGDYEIKYLVDEPIQIIENHFYVPLERFDNLKSPKHFPPPVNRYTINKMKIKWLMYGGNDFPSSISDPSNSNDRDVTTRSRGFSKSDSETRDNFQFESLKRNHVHISKNTGVSFSKVKHEVTMGSRNDDLLVSPKESSAPEEVSWKKLISSSKSWITNGGPCRRYDVLIWLCLENVSFQHESYPETAVQASRQVLLIRNIEMYDKLASSQLNTLLIQYYSESMQKSTHADMLTIKAVHRRCDPDKANQECDLKVTLLPLRLYIDQDALIFISEFFGKLTARTEDCGLGRRGSDFGKNMKTAFHHPPVMTVGKAVAASTPPLNLTRSDNSESQNNLIQLDDSTSQRSRSGSISSTSTTSSIISPIFFSSFEFTNDVRIFLDYQGKRYEPNNGPLLGLVLGFAQLNRSELVLKKLSHRGILGLDRLVNDAINEWIKDIKTNQIPGLLAGVGPLHSFVQLINGFRDLFWLPIEQYRKDGRIVRGLQRGANAFTSSTTIAILEITNRLVGALQSTAETAYDVVNPGPSVRCRRGQRRVTRKPHQSADLMEGVTNAYHVVREGFSDTAMTIVRVASQEHEQKGISGAVGGVLRQLPSAVVLPFAVTAEATCNVLEGMKNQIDPDVRREAEEKWRPEN